MTCFQDWEHEKVIAGFANTTAAGAFRLLFSKSQERAEIMTVQEVLTTYDLPKFVLAELSECSPQDVSVYLRRGQLAPHKVSRIERSASDLEMIFKRLQLMGDATGIYLTVRVRDVNSIRRFIEWVKKNPEPETAQPAAQQVSA